MNGNADKFVEDNVTRIDGEDCPILWAGCGLTLDQVEATTNWFDEQRKVRNDEDEMTQEELQEHTDDWHDSH